MCSTNGKSSGLTEEEIVVGGIGHVNLDDMKKIRRLLIIDNHELPKLDKEEVPQVEYLSVIDSCMHIAKVPRPDISYAIDVFSRHSSKPGQVHMAAAQDLVKYLYGSRELQIEYKRQKRDGNVPIVFEIGEEVPWRTLDSRLQASTPNEIPGNQLQKITAQSSAESEIYAVCEALKEAIHIKLLCEETGIRASNKPMAVYEDNSACIALGHSLKNSKSAKHFQVRLRFLQEHVRDKTIEFEKVNTKGQLADGFTKALPREAFESFRGRMLVHSDND